MCASRGCVQAATTTPPRREHQRRRRLERGVAADPLGRGEAPTRTAADEDLDAVAAPAHEVARCSMPKSAVDVLRTARDTAGMYRLGAVIVVAIACLALPAAAPAQASLTPSQFAAIDAVYVAFAAFDDDDGATAADRRAARAACAALGSADMLLAVLRRSCSGQLDVGQALGIMSRCRGRASCLAGARLVQRALTTFMSQRRAVNRAVIAAGLSAACTRELRTDMKTFLYLTRLRAGFAQLERALRARSVALAQRARRRINALKEPDRRSVAQSGEDYRAACAPPA